MVIETAQWVIVGDQPKLGATVPRGAIRPNVAEDVLVPATFPLVRFDPGQMNIKSGLPEQGGGVYFCFSDPGRLVS